MATIFNKLVNDLAARALPKFDTLLPRIDDYIEKSLDRIISKPSPKTQSKEQQALAKNIGLAATAAAPAAITSSTASITAAFLASDLALAPYLASTAAHLGAASEIIGSVGLAAEAGVGLASAPMLAAGIGVAALSLLAGKVANRAAGHALHYLSEDNKTEETEVENRPTPRMGR